MKSIHKLLAMVFVLGTFPGRAETFSIVRPPSCKTAEGTAVKFYGLPHNLFEDGGPLIARSFVNYKNEPTTYFDIDVLKHFPAQFQNQVLYHECAHHELGHVGNYSHLNPKEREGIEPDADCRSIQKLRDELKYEKEDLDVIARSIEILFKKLGVPQNLTSERVRLLRTCFDSSPPTPDSIDLTKLIQE